MSGKIKLQGRYRRIAEKLLKRITGVLYSCGIPYWLDYGTLLGIVREQRLLPWDSDMDISIARKDLDRLLANLWRFRIRGYKVRIRYHRQDDHPLKKGSVRLIKIFNRKYLVARGDVMLDIFVNTRVEEAYTLVMGIKNYTRFSVPAHYFDNLGTIRFRDRPYSVPAEYEEYLAYRYGDWRTPREDWNFYKDDLAISNSDQT
ncbi:MAG: LicD family protein [Candidatus Neomarinimicrobiota bacterium]